MKFVIAEKNGTNYYCSSVQFVEEETSYKLVKKNYKIVESACCYRNRFG